MTAPKGKVELDTAKPKRRVLTEAERKAKTRKTNKRRRDARARAKAEAALLARPVPNPWLVGALVRVIEVGFDKDKTGYIETVETLADREEHTVTVRLRDGNLVKFLGTQLVLV